MSENEQKNETEKTELLSDLELAAEEANQTTAGTTARSGGMSAGKVSVHDLA